MYVCASWLANKNNTTPVDSASRLSAQWDVTNFISHERFFPLFSHEEMLWEGTKYVKIRLSQKNADEWDCLKKLQWPTFCFTRLHTIPGTLLDDIARSLNSSPPGTYLEGWKNKSFQQFVAFMGRWSILCGEKIFQPVFGFITSLDFVMHKT